ncbi:DUF7882 family protein [Burkholderia cenocepacia]|uniref:DUF7882 family protein n=1 Tax=Burkholderia cenocepacia TaxID=95486 RepID=UPI0038CBFC75
MGTLTYDGAAEPFEVDDALLAHLEAVIVAKLRRREPFLLTFVSDDARSAVWIHESSDLRCSYETGTRVDLDRARLEAMVRDSHHASGLVVSVDHLPQTSETA